MKERNNKELRGAMPASCGRDLHRRLQGPGEQDGEGTRMDIEVSEHDGGEVGGSKDKDKVTSTTGGGQWGVNEDNGGEENRIEDDTKNKEDNSQKGDDKRKVEQDNKTINL